MLASPMVPEFLRFPLLASPKLDGVRCICFNGKPMSRSMKVIPNRHIQRLFAENATMLEGLDGELICGKPYAEHPEDNVFNRTVGNVMHHDGEPEFTFWTFDCIVTDGGFKDRLHAVEMLAIDKKCPDWMMVVPHLNVIDLKTVNAFEAGMVEMGYEGTMLRDPNGPYKQGRSTAREGYLLKVKRHADAEAVIVGFEEEMENTNEATKNEIGRTKRSVAVEGLVGKGRLGAFRVKGLDNQAWSGVEFSIGTGIDHASRQSWWDARESLVGKLVTYLYQPVGSLDAPRHPVFKGFRDPIDME
jgi:DNA ligase-1